MKNSTLLLAIFMFSISSIVNAQLKIGSKAPTLLAKTIDNKIIDTKQWVNHKPVYLLFFSPYDPVGLEKSQQLYSKYKNSVNFVGLAPAMNMNETIVKSVMQANNIDYSIIFDGTNEYFRLLEAWNQPTQILIDRNGEINFYSQDANADIEQAIQKLIAKGKK